MKKLISLLLCAVMLLSFVACGGGEATVTTQKPETEAAPADTTVAESTTAAPADETTKAAETTAAVTTAAEETTSGEPEYGENEFGTLTEEQLAAFKDLLPALLPDNTVIEKFVRPFCLDETFDSENFGNHYQLAGNSQPQTKYVGTDAGALYGLALNISSCGQSASKRAEVTVTPYEDVSVVGAKGVLFYVDFSHTDIQTDTTQKTQYCASVTFNNNDYRSNKDSNGSVGYYYQDGVWVETKNVNACRMELPNQFKGWVYVPATSYVKSNDKTLAITDAEGRFVDFDVIKNVRLYTDGYVYTDAEDKYIIFDEILFVY